jgi:hypothetical protein
MKEIIATLATELNDGRVTPDAIRKWDERGKVPHRLRLPLIELAKRKRIALSARDFDFTPKNERAA